MPLPARCLAILDVGHGNSAVVSTPEGVVVIDAGPGNVLQEYLVENHITRVDAVLLSHSDEDHIAGLLGLLGDGRFEIKKIRANSDALKGSALWDDLLSELEQLGLSGNGDFLPALTSAQSGEFDLGTIRIQVLGPGTYLAAKGPGATAAKENLAGANDRRITSNSISAVVRVCNGITPLALLTGDVDDVGLDNMVALNVDGATPLLVFPHHGGRARGSDSTTFTGRLCQFAKPKTVIFSIGRHKHENPRPEVVRAIRAFDATARIGCTQLSKHCTGNLPTEPSGHLSGAYARGRDERACCLGTALIDLDNPSAMQPALASHAEFVKAVAPDALCLK
jgi:beta-lactamase superfamily II metal-dependent hydrolase